MNKLPHWFTYTNFRAFLREMEVDRQMLGYIGDSFHCPFCSFIEANAEAHSTVSVSFKGFKINKVVYKMPKWGERFQREVNNLVDELEFNLEEEELERERPASFFLDHLIKTGARVNTSVT